MQKLSKCERFKLTNIVLVGLLPSPKDPSKAINTHLEPFINNLIKLHQEVEIPPFLKDQGCSQLYSMSYATNLKSVWFFRS